MRLSHTVSQPHSSGSVKPHSSGAIKQASVRRPCVVFKIKPPKCETEDDETSESEIAKASETSATRPAIDLSRIDWVVHPDSKRILFFLQGDDWFIDEKLLPPEFVSQAYRETLGCRSCGD
jgi:hypothetical protein